MKLTIEHLAPYLPHELSVNLFNRNYTVTGLTHETIFTKEGAVLNYSSNENEIKPILRPLSDLDKLGVDFETGHDINVKFSKEHNLDYGFFEHYKGEIEFIKESDSTQGYDSEKSFKFEVFELVRNELLKSHYDIFGLIDAGLAIDIKTLES